MQKQINFKTESVLDKREKYEDLIKARWVLTEVQQQTQQRFKDVVESLVTMAIKSVFDRPFKFELEFERKRNQMECHPIVKEIVGDQERIYDNPEDDMGGGILDIISFAFHIVLWSLEKPRSRNVFIMDEPMKNLGKLIVLGGKVLKEISKKLHIQIILVTHDEELLEIADKAFVVTHNGNKSFVTPIVKNSVGIIQEQIVKKSNPIKIRR